MFSRSANSIDVGNAAALAAAIAGASNGNGARLVDTQPGKTTFSNVSIDNLGIGSPVFLCANLDMTAGVSYALNISSYGGAGTTALGTAPAGVVSLDLMLIWLDASGTITLAQETFEVLTGNAGSASAQVQTISGPAKGSKLSVIAIRANANVWGTPSAATLTIVNHSKPLPFTTTAPNSGQNVAGTDGVLLAQSGTLAASGSAGPFVCWPSLGLIQASSFAAGALTVQYRYGFGLARNVLIQRVITFPAGTTTQTSDNPEFIACGRPLVVSMVNLTAAAASYNLYVWSNLER
jgi:hypothetical protein